MVDHPRRLVLMHTSDWHLGRTLHGQRRHDEHAAFLDWLAARADEYAVDVLVVAGDVFDSVAPGHTAQSLYYGFLQRIARPGRRHVVVVAGNHDSPSLLDAPSPLLRGLDVHVTGVPGARPEDDVRVLERADGSLMAVCCAIPYLRDRDLRTSEAGESPDDRERQRVDAVASRYAAAAAYAEGVRAERHPDAPWIVTGHAFAAGGKTVEGDGVRSLYVGSLGGVPATVFPAAADYVALGHLHTAQTVGGRETVRYSGAPMAMGFDESDRPKQVMLVTWEGPGTPTVRPLDVPRFRRLARVRGDAASLLEQVRAHVGSGEATWLEAVYEGEAVPGDWRTPLAEAVAGSPVAILRSRNARPTGQVLTAEAGDDEGAGLAGLDVDTVFGRCLDAHGVPEDQRAELWRTFREVRDTLADDDPKAED